MALVIATNQQGKQVIAEKSEAEAFGWKVSTPSNSGANAGASTAPAPQENKLGVTPQELVSNANKGGGILQTTGSAYTIKPSSEFMQSEAKKEISKTAGEPVTKVEDIRNPSGALAAQYFRGESGKLYYYDYAKSNLTAYRTGAERISIPTASGVNVVLSESVTQKVGGIEGLKQLMYMRNLTYQSQSVVDQALNLAVQGKDTVMRTPEEMIKIQAEDAMIQAEDAMISERASRVETFAYYGMNIPRTAMIGLGASIALAAGVPIESIRAADFEMRKQFVREHLADPIGRTAREMFDIATFMIFAAPKSYSIAMDAIKASAYAEYILPAVKPMIIGTSAFVFAKGAYESVGAGIDIAAKGVDLFSATRLAGGLIQAGGGALGIYAGWKMPAYYSEVKWDKPVKSKEIVYSDVDISERVINGKVIDKLVNEGSASAEVTQHGTSEGYWGLVKKDIWIKGFPETTFESELGSKITNSVTWNPSVGIEKTFIFNRQLGENYLYPTGYSKAASFAMGKIDTSISIPTKEGIGEFGMKLGKGSINFPEFSGDVTKSFTISKNAVFDGANIQVGSTITFSESTLIKSISEEIKPPSKDIVIGTAKGGTITYPDFSSSVNNKILEKAFYQSTSTTFNLKEAGVGYITISPQSPLKGVSDSFLKTIEPVIATSSGGGGKGFTISKPDTGLSFGGGELSQFDFTAMQPDSMRDIEKTAAITGTSLWKPFYPSRTRTYEDTTYVTYPQEKNEITMNLGNMQNTMTKTMSSQKLELNLESSMSLKSQQQLGLTSLQQLGLSSRSQSQTELQLQQQLQLQLQLQQMQQLNLQQMQQLNLQNLTPLNTEKIVTAPIPFIFDEFKIIVKPEFGEPKIFKVSSRILPTASMYSLERSFAKYGSGSLARGANIEKVFRNIARSSGLAAEFPAAEFIKRGGRRR